MRLLYGGERIEARCGVCEKSWAVGVRTRVALGEMVAAACGAAVAPPSPQLKVVID
jgi:hypothetical protein